MNSTLSKYDEKESIDFLAEINEDTKIKDKEFTHYQLHDALLWIEDILGRGIIKWVLVGEIGEQMYKYNDPTLFADKVEIEILRGDFTESGRSMISTWIPNAKDETLTELKVDYDGVPIYIKIIDEDPGYLKNPDRRFYYVSEFNIPNPFEVYLDVRNNKH